MGHAHKDYLTAQEKRAQIRKEKGLGWRKKGSAKARNKGRDTATCLCCGLNRLKCTCSGHMSEDAHKRFREEQINVY